ncbi:streptomycin 6-kinase [Nocardioides luteus]|uniref:Streptomycin 6-kinase n=1 Tax=Nocardioides luteus TaxID=1844 RepID=A0ABQ5T1Q6_9ACTN|nr:aminoglycoside phosphotransferase family protein [Nocardioides luteus]MDR7311556.1 streptomycin 6-kinase [Nocardioides luteus]GGR54781.1 streptomycin 6-kinase [Nocardioides luteus]GLJ70205.1 streptomycin 6-kinase [Nocardioides luteus]
MTWLEELAEVARDLREEWALTPDGEPTNGRTALVHPVRTADGRPTVLKVVRPHWEAEHEALALQTWGGRGVVRLLRADPRRFAILLERLHTEDLSGLWDVQACEIVGGFYRRLHVPAPPQLRTLSDQAARWERELGEKERRLPVPPRMVEQARSIARDFAKDGATDGRLIHTDLHFENVLRGDREEWLVIDPKPLSGDPHYEVAPMLWNRFDEYAGRIRDGVRMRFFALVDTAELDEDRARAWAVLRLVVNVKGELEDNPTPDKDWITAMISVAKAVQD